MLVEKRTAGLSLESLACKLAYDESCKANSSRPIAERIPPSIIATSIRPRHLQLDQWFPGIPIGTAEQWPLEARIVDGFSRRMPVGILWDQARRNEGWKVTEDDVIDPMDALAVAAVDSVSLLGSGSSIGLIIPDWLRQLQQQSLLNSLSGTGKKWTLIWRPIAATTYWIQHFANLLLTRDKRHREIIGRIATLHLGLFDCELVFIDLVIEKEKEHVCILPARRRNQRRGTMTLQSSAPGIISDQLANTARKRNRNSNDWRQLFLSTWISDQIGAWRGNIAKLGKEDRPAEYSPSVVEIHEIESRNYVSCQGVQWSSMSLEAAQSWIRQSLRLLGSEELASSTSMGHARLSGLVVTGELACIAAQDGWLDGISRHLTTPSKILVEGLTAPETLLSQGAAMQCRRIDVGEPSYLTKLPLLRTVISNKGEPEWRSLMSDDDQYVMGGKRWERPEPVKGLKIPRGRILSLVIDHEDLEHVRETTIEIPVDFQPNQPAELHVAITPAQGNARVELRTESERRRRDPVVADLSRMIEMKKDDGNPIAPSEFLDWYPRIAPKINKRLASANRWEAIKPDIEMLLKTPTKNWKERVVRSLRDDIRQKVSLEGKNITALGSDGLAPNRQELLDELGYRLLEALRENKSQLVEMGTLLRCLAYTSWTSPELEQYIEERLLGFFPETDPELRVIGNCLRSPILIARFLQSCLSGLSNGRIRVIAELTSYRTEALQSVSSDDVLRLYDKTSQIFIRETHYRSLDFRYLTMCVAFLLRRRIFEDEFLPPDSEVAMKVKFKCEKILEEIESGRKGVMRGAVDLPAVMRQLVEYIDRRGRGAFMWSADS